MEALGFELVQVYGLIETYGSMVVFAWRDEWDDLSLDEKSALKARQGISSVLAGSMMVADEETLEPVPWGGETQGEVFMRGNIVMKGYLKNPSATEAAFRGRWLHSGDMAVCHPDGYIQIKDCSKDFIVLGGENLAPCKIPKAVVVGKNFHRQSAEVPVDRNCRVGRLVVRQHLPGLDRCCRSLSSLERGELL